MISMHRHSKLSIVEWVVICIACVILLFIFFPIFAYYTKCDVMVRPICFYNQQRIATALIEYAQDNDETFPIPSSWQMIIKQYPNDNVTCPQSQHIASTISPDYGMNAYLFDIDKSTKPALPTGVPIRNIVDPSITELTADISGMTGNIDSPFPNTYTVIGYGPKSNIAHRHADGVYISFVDGRAEYVLFSHIGPRPSRYCLPR